MKLCNFLKENTAIIATVAAAVSAFTALFSYRYNLWISKAAPALDDVSSAIVVKDPNNLDINFKFKIKNVGREKFTLTDISVFRVDFQRKIYERVGQSPVLNPIHSDCSFNYEMKLFFFDKDKKGSFVGDNKELEQKLPGLIGKQVLILRIVYKASGKLEVMKYFLGYQYPTVSLLSKDEYSTIEKFLPNEFKVDE